ncbi:hypothetical protein ACFP1Z_25895 [Streptomyces gamaensis]|uniref:Uncharacterized protein n=1 Tax=Streptomyces gamaensis TaxID=1763542 RepID=A0ABW0Z450_9ACTN
MSAVPGEFTGGQWISGVTAAEPGRRFTWVVLDSAGRPQDSTWTVAASPAKIKDVVGERRPR